MGDKYRCTETPDMGVQLRGFCLPPADLSGQRRPEGRQRLCGRFLLLLPVPCVTRALGQKKVGLVNFAVENWKRGSLNSIAGGTLTTSVALPFEVPQCILRIAN